MDTENSGNVSWSAVPKHWPAQTDLVTWCRDMNAANAALLVMFGLVYLFYGFYLYRYLVMTNAAWIGGWIGYVLSRHSGSQALAVVTCAFIAAAVTWPTMKYSVAVMGGLFGALFGAAVWNSAGLDQHFAWAGALSGLIGFGMLSFIIFRGSLMMYKSLQGSVMLIFGLLGLLCKYQSVGPTVTSHIKMQPIILPMAILIAMVCGIVYQHANHPTPSGAPPAKK
jgi:hypothetical protein